MAGHSSPKSRAAKIRERANSAAQDQTHLSRHFAMLESELGNRTSGNLLYAEPEKQSRSYAGVLFLMLLTFSATLAYLAYQNGAFNSWLGSDGAIIQKSKPWIKANDYKIIFVPVPAKDTQDTAVTEDAQSDDSATHDVAPQNGPSAAPAAKSTDSSATPSE